MRRDRIGSAFDTPRLRLIGCLAALVMAGEASAEALFSTSFFAAGERTSIRAVAFNQGEDVTLLSDPVDILYVLRPSNSTDGVELHVRKIVAAG